MGFFGNLFKGVKKIGHSIGSGVKKIAHVVHQGTSAVSKLGHKVHDVIDKGYKTLKKIPVVGEAVDKVVNTQFLPGVSVGRLADVANLGLEGVDVVNDATGALDKLGDSIQKGDVRGAINSGKSLRGSGLGLRNLARQARTG